MTSQTQVLKPEFGWAKVVRFNTVPILEQQLDNPGRWNGLTYERAIGVSSAEGGLL
jgi:hypothetical protein